MNVVLGATSGLPYLVAAAFVLSMLLFLGGWAVWLAFVRGRPWAVVALLGAAALAGAFGLLLSGGFVRQLVPILVIAAFLVSLGPARPDSPWARHRQARAEGQRDSRFYVLPFLIGVGLAILPLIGVSALWMADGEDRYPPPATVEGMVTLSSDRPTAALAVEVTLQGGLSGLEGILTTSAAPSGTTAGIRAAEMSVALLEGGVVGEPFEGGFRIASTCTECSYRFRTTYPLIPPESEPVDVRYEMTFRTEAGYELWPDEVPVATMTARETDAP